MKVVKIKGIESGGRGTRGEVREKGEMDGEEAQKCGKLVFNFLFKMAIFARSYAVG